MSLKGKILKMINKDLKIFSWDFLSKALIVVFLFLQLARSVIMPQFMDIYYHLHTAWGFLQAGGYSGWDFWQYAPVGRVHIYPPLFHLILAAFIKLGLSQVILAKACEVFLPWLLLLVTWHFIRENYSQRLSFFVVFSFFLSFSFYQSLLNHAPATFALILGVLSLGRLFKQQLLRSVIFLSLCFYTHIGVSIYFLLAFFIYGLFDANRRKVVFKVIIITLILAAPMLIKELLALKYISIFGFQLNEKYLIQIKLIEYLLAGLGLFVSFKLKDKYRLFLSLFLANFIFIAYPYRFFSAEGYFAILLLSAVSLDYLYQRISRKYIVVLFCIFTILVSPTLMRDKPTLKENMYYRINFFDSALLGMLFARGQQIWFPDAYITAAEIVKSNSGPKDIVFSTMSLTGSIISSLAGRASANALLPEIKPAQAINPFLTSKIIIFTAIDEQALINKAQTTFSLSKLGENKLFKIYSNPNCYASLEVKRASLPFWSIFLIAVSLIFIYIYL